MNETSGSNTKQWINNRCVARNGKCMWDDEAVSQVSQDDPDWRFEHRTQPHPINEYTE